MTRGALGRQPPGAGRGAAADFEDLRRPSSGPRVPASDSRSPSGHQHEVDIAQEIAVFGLVHVGVSVPPSAVGVTGSLHAVTARRLVRCRSRVVWVPCVLVGSRLTRTLRLVTPAAVRWSLPAVRRSAATKTLLIRAEDCWTVWYCTG